MSHTDLPHLKKTGEDSELFKDYESSDYGRHGGDFGAPQGSTGLKVSSCIRRLGLKDAAVAAGTGSEARSSDSAANWLSYGS